MSNPATLKPFVKGDPRINRKGRPKSFDALRALTLDIGNEIATIDGRPVIKDGTKLTNVIMVLRQLMKDNPERFLEIGWGKVPQPVELTGANGGAVAVQFVEIVRPPKDNDSTLPD